MWNPEVNMWNPLDWGQSIYLSDLEDLNAKSTISQNPLSCTDVGPRFVGVLVVSQTRTAVYDEVFKQVPVGSRQMFEYKSYLNPETPSRTLKSL